MYATNDLKKLAQHDYELAFSTIKLEKKSKKRNQLRQHLPQWIS
ncbi:hypothetical protein FM106_12575 [Brachybacterium faecium]|nr:hypothetical protein FM106_12575 [Brachybacterium faecium]